MSALITMLFERLKNAVTSHVLWDVTNITAPPAASSDDNANSEHTAHMDAEAEFDEQASSESEPRADEQHEAGQAVRLGAYLSFSEPAEEDFTDGPVRMVEAFDGIKRCSALLMTLDLVDKIQYMLNLQKQYLKQEHKAEQETEAIQNFNAELGEQISKHKARMSIDGSRSPDEDGHSPELDRVHDELQMLHLLKEKMTAKQRNIDINRERRAHLLRDAQLDVNEYLQDAFVVAQLVAPETEESEPAVPSYDLQIEYAKLLQQLCQVSEQGSELHEPLDTSIDFLRKTVPERTKEQQAKHEIGNRYAHAKIGLEQAQERFEGRRAARREAKENMEVAELDGEEITESSIEAFDLHWLFVFRDLAQELKAAEDEFAQARLEAAKAGILATFENDQSSCFLSNPEDGMFLSLDPEDAEIARPKIQRWLANISEDDNVEGQGPVDLDDLDLDEVEIDDSLSAIELGSRRPKIDRWRQAPHSGKQHDWR